MEAISNEVVVKNGTAQQPFHSGDIVGKHVSGIMVCFAVKSDTFIKRNDMPNSYR